VCCGGVGVLWFVCFVLFVVVWFLVFGGGGGGGFGGGGGGHEIVSDFLAVGDRSGR